MNAVNIPAPAKRHGTAGEPMSGALRRPAARSVEVTKLPPTTPATARRPALLRAAAYIRVSTADPSQQDSLWAQQYRLTQMIMGNPDCAYAGAYRDDGVSGYKADRPAFTRLMADARAGKIDLIYTKSISRFARNTELLLRAVRELQSLGVGVIFDEQGIDTRTAQGEVMISVMGAVAEAERTSISGNVRWALRKRIESGNTQHMTNAPYGYTRTESGLIPDGNAEVVRGIFDRYIGGDSCKDIADRLNGQGVPAPGGGCWRWQSVYAILTREKYKGDCLYFKQHRLVDGRRVYNHGTYDQYYVEDNHPGIVDEETWTAAQALKDERLQSGRSDHSGRLKCPHCHTSLTRVVVKGRVFWCCRKSLRAGKAACPGIRVPEEALTELEAGRTYAVREDDNAAQGAIIATVRVHGHEKVYRFEEITGRIYTNSRRV